MATMVVLAMESANSWLPKVPAYVAGLCVGYAKFLVAPVLAPIGHWKSIRKPDLAAGNAAVTSCPQSL